MVPPVAPRSPTGMLPPIAPRSSTGLLPQVPLRSPTGLQPALRSPEGSAGKDDEWEDLPHLDSTILSHPSGGGAAVPAAPPAVAKRPSPVVRDRGDLPTIQPHEAAPAIGVSPRPEEAPDHTLANSDLAGLPGSAQFEDLPTPVKGTPALRDIGVASSSVFEEDTNKGDGPRGMPHPGPDGSDASVELNDDDFEAFE